MSALLLSLCLLSASDDLALKLDEASALAERGKTRAAIDAFSALEASGVDGRGLHYNLGTLYLDAGELGRAMQHLLRAQQIESHPDIAHNLEAARRLRRDRVEGRARESVVLRVGRAFSAQTVSAIFLTSFAMSALLVAFASIRRRRRFVAAAMVMLLAPSLLLAARVVNDSVRYGVVAKETGARSAPSDSAKKVFVAHDGLAGVVKEERGGFVRLRLDNGLDAWFERDALVFTSGSP